MLKRILLLGIVLSFCAGFLFAQTAYPPSMGDGSSSNPYQIASLENLRWLSETEGVWGNDTYFIQTNDIDASLTKNWNNNLGFLPIGNNGKMFDGNYCGNGYVISDIFSQHYNQIYLGVFGYVGSNASLSDIVLTNVNIRGKTIVGGLAGLCYYGNISNCYVEGTVTSEGNGASGVAVGGLIGYVYYGNITNSHANSSVYGQNDNEYVYSGGLIGFIENGSVSDCYAGDSVSAEAHLSEVFIGGLIGIQKLSDINNSYSSAKILGKEDQSESYYGGLIGESNGGTISFSFATGQISGKCGSSQSFIGGLVGRNMGCNISNCYSTEVISVTEQKNNFMVGGFIGKNWLGNISNCYSKGYVSSKGLLVGGFIGVVDQGYYRACFWDHTINDSLDGVSCNYSNDGILDKTTTEMRLKNTYTDKSWDFENIWNISEYINEGYPFLQYQQAYSAPIIKADSTEILSNSKIKVNFTILELGFPALIDHGVCWNLSENPSFDDKHISLGEINSSGSAYVIIDSLQTNTCYYLRVYAVNDIDTVYSNELVFTVSESSVSVMLPSEFRLVQNYPNPFNPTTTLQYGLPEATDINLSIFDITGRKVKQWDITSQQPGYHEIIWDGRNANGNIVPTGVYIYSLRAGDFVDTKKMVFMK